MKTNQAGLELIQRFEGLRLKAYQDSVGVWTIGYGHTGGVKSGQIITREQADELLRDDLSTAEGDVERLVRVPITPNQHAALVSFAFNLGGGNLGRSTLLRRLNAKDYAAAAKEFLKWNRAGGRVLPGLTKRRQAESNLFLS